MNRGAGGSVLLACYAGPGLARAGVQGYKHRDTELRAVLNISADSDQQGDTSHTPDPSICGQQKLSEITEKTDFNKQQLQTEVSVSKYC